MSPLEDVDLRAVLEFLLSAEESTLDRPDVLRDAVLDGLVALVPCDIVAWRDGGAIAFRRRDAGAWGPAGSDALAGPDGPTNALDALLRGRGMTDVVCRRAHDAGGAVEYGCGLRHGSFSGRDRAIVSLIEPYAARVLLRASGALALQPSVVGGGLTRREAEVLDWVARGKSNAEVAAILFVAPGTVKKHLDNIYDKLSVGSRTEAAAVAFAARSAGSPARLREGSAALDGGAVG